nr:hypothetical protein [Paenibacillus pinihumi]
MSRRELKKVFVVEKIRDGHMTNNEGAIALGDFRPADDPNEEKI